MNKSIQNKHIKDIDKKKDYLDWLYNKYGPFDVMFDFDKDGQKYWSKWRDYLEARENEWFLEKARHRTICNSEVVVDIEDPTIFDFVINKMNKYGFCYKAFSTGSRGYHIHMIFPDILFLNDSQRSEIKKQITQFFMPSWLNYNIDLQKHGGRVPIAIEGVPHWKTGNRKVNVKEELGHNRPSNQLWGQIRGFAELGEKSTTRQLFGLKNGSCIREH